jgi:hypothetical protein
MLHLSLSDLIDEGCDTVIEVMKELTELEAEDKEQL